MGSFGDKFRQERERRGITLDEVSGTTKISARMLKAIEDEHFDQLPGGVFNKGFIRAYARQIGIDEEQAVTDYLAALREEQIQAQNFMPEFRPLAERAPEAPKVTEVAPPAAPKPPTRPASKPSPPKKEELSPEQLMEHLAAHRPTPLIRSFERRTPWGTLAAVVVVAALVIAIVGVRRRADRASASAPVKAAESQTASASSASEPPRADAQTAQTARTANNKSPEPSHSPAPATVTAPSSVVAAPSAPGTLTSGSPSAGAELSLPPGPSSTSANSTPAPKPASSGGSAGAAAKSPATTSATPKPAAPNTEVAAPVTRAAAPSASTTFKLVIRADETSWVTITADGHTVAEETLIAPAGKSIFANQEIVVKTGNAGGLTFVFNDKELPKQGASGEVKTFIFNGQGMRAASAQETDTNR